MADLSFVGVTSGTDSTLTVSSVNVAAPGSTASGDLDLMLVSAAVITGGAGPPTLSMGAGWEQVATFTYTGQGSLDGRQSVFRRNGSTVQTETITASANSAFSWDRMVYSGQHPSTPITVTPVLGINAAGTSQVIPSITTDNPRALAIYQLGGLSATTTWTPGSGVTERSDHNAACTGDILQATAGAVGTKTFTAAVSNITLYAVVAANSDFLRITAQPADQTVNNGATATFSVTVTGGTTAYGYQWQDDSSGSFADIGGATSSSYAPTAAYSMQGRQYRCVITDAISSTVTSSAATLRVATNLTGTGPRSFPILGGGPIGAGAVGEVYQAAVSAGTHTTTGALASGAATVAGSAAHLTLHTTSGALASQAATLAGSAAHQVAHATSGALAAQSATMTGAAVRTRIHATDGALSAQAAALSGAAVHPHTTTGALSAQAAAMSGAAVHPHTTSGTLAAQAATVAGAALHPHTTSGALSAQDATLSGSADHTTAGASHSTSGALAAGDATLSGSATHLTLHTTTGALASGASSVAGAAVHPHTTSGALPSQAASVAGSAAHSALHATSGALAAGDASITGDAQHATVGTHDASGALQAVASSLAGVAEHVSAQSNSAGWGHAILAQARRRAQEATRKAREREEQDAREAVEQAAQLRAAERAQKLAVARKLEAAQQQALERELFSKILANMMADAARQQAADQIADDNDALMLILAVS